jgi:hypothetical protein
MSVHAGTILHVGANNVIDRIQSAGLGDVRLPMETIREVGNREVVDKVPGEPDFTFTMESLDVSTSTEAWLTGAIGGEGSASAPGAADANGTAYDWLDMVGRCVNIPSPWKDATSGSAGNVEAGHLIPGYYPTRIRYRFGVTDNATQEVELSGGSFFYGEYAPVEQFETGDGSTTDFATDDPAIRYRRGGAGGTVFRSVFGVIVDGELQVEDIDYTVTGGAVDPGSTATIAFEEAPVNDADIRFVYFTSVAQAYPQSVHASVNVTPGAVRGRNIHVYMDAGDGLTKIGGVQSAELEGTVDGEAERELGSEDPVGRVINGTDARGSLTVRSRDAEAFFDLLALVTGVARDEIYGWFNENEVELQIRIENPKSPGTILKTLRIADAKFQPPGTPARVNTATDFVFNFESVNGSFQSIKGVPA